VEKREKKRSDREQVNPYEGGKLWVNWGLRQARRGGWTVFFMGGGGERQFTQLRSWVQVKKKKKREKKKGGWVGGFSPGGDKKKRGTKQPMLPFGLIGGKRKKDTR